MKIVNAKLQPGIPTSGLDARLNWGNFLNEHHPEVAMRTATYVPHTDNMQDSKQPTPSPATSNNPNNPSKTCSLYGTSIPSQPLPKPNKQAPTPHVHQPVPILQHPVDPRLPSLRPLHPAPTQNHSWNRHRPLVLDRQLGGGASG